MKESEIEKLKVRARKNYDMLILLYMFAMANAFWNMGLYTLAQHRLFLYSTILSVLPILAVGIYIIIDEWNNHVTFH